MTSRTPTDHPVHELISRRWSPRAFSDALLEHEQLLSIFEAARWAASSKNEQPWSFVVATRDDAQGFQQLFGCLMPGNQGWAGQAATLVLAVAETRREDGTTNRYAMHDTALAVSNLILQATSMGFHAHQMGGFDREAASAEVGLPDTHDPVSMIAIGRAAGPDTLPEDLRERELQPRTRRPLNEFVYGPAWGEVSGLVR
jgi:nitroreductase